MENKVLTAPIALIKLGGEIVGKMKSVRCTETFRRGRVAGLGELTPQELPALEWNGTLSASAFSINLRKFGTVSGKKIGLNRETGDVKKFVDTVTLNEVPVDIYINKKGASVIDSATGIVTEVEELDYAVIEGFYIDSQSFDINEGQIAGQDISGTYMNPVVLPILT